MIQMFQDMYVFQPASLCAIDGFDGSVEAVAGGGGGFDSSAGNDGGAAGNGGPGGGYATTSADLETLSGLAAVGIVSSGVTGLPGGGLGVGGVFGLASGSSPATATFDLAHDMSLGLGQAVTANPSYSMFGTDSTSLAATGGSAFGGGSDPAFFNNTMIAPEPGSGGGMGD
jgi:hypothetical protein